ncbi:hypothetical protein [Phenylobacterium sp.]|uniref:hypothetical protein n=1 Tax=Phenylobacterium sp. TaxID=1871053 RepID=UPI002F4106AD
MDVIFTIVSRNYAAQAATLMDSLAVAEPQARRVVVATDGPMPQLESRAEVIAAEDLGAPLAAMSVHYEALELNTAVKPFAFKRLLTEPGVTSATYLDPDIYVFQPLDAVRAGLAQAQLVLTPHVTRPLLGEAAPNDRDFLRSGIYNLGFASMRNEPRPVQLLEWWADRCRFDCRVDLVSGLFTDQKWMDLSPGFVDSLSLIRDPGLNLAYWNLEGRNLFRGADGWTVDGRPLVFFHFSGFDPNRPRTLSRHQNRVGVEPGSPLAELLAEFAQAMLRNGHNETAAIPYAHNRFADGRAVTPAMRRTALAAARRGWDFSEGLSAATSAWFDAPAPEAAAPGLPDITRLMDGIWRDATAADPFDRTSLEGRLSFHRWFEDNAAALGADETAVEAARALLRAGAAAREPDPSVWRDVPWTGPAAKALDWLRRTGASGEPRAVTALMAARRDLRQRFDADPAARLAWCLGPEAAAGRFAADLLPDAQVAALAQDPTPLYAAARFADASTGGDLRRRLFAGFGLGERARWPAAMTAPLRAPWLRPAPGLPEPFVALFLEIWESRGDLQRLYPLGGFAQRLRYLRWLIAGGLAEYGVELMALPPVIRNHPTMLLAALSVRKRLSTPPAGNGACAHLVVMERAERLAGLSADVLVYDAGASRFLTPGGAAATAPRSAGTAYFLTAPPLVPADAMALHARGVAVSRALGVWDVETAARLDAGEIGLGFVDQVWSDGPAPPGLSRPAGLLDRNHPLQAALLGLIGA